MSTTPLISIIIPTLNAADTITECLISISGQTYKAVEIIIIDGNSTDGTVEIIESFQKTMPIKYYSEPANGIYDAMNKGIEKATGSYLYFLGSDDTIYDQNVLQEIAEIIKDGNEKVIYGNVKMNGENQWVKDGTLYGGEFDLKRLFSHNIPHQAIFYPCNLFKKIGNYNTRYSLFADHDMNIRAFAKYEFRYTDLLVAHFTVGGASTRFKDEEFQKDKIKNIIQYYHDRLNSKEFIPLRLYVQQAAFNRKLKLPLITRIYCMFVYAKLKIEAYIN